ncbi:hypothetical protein HD806DRAFT_301490 [Xylariaceae sp. AK1471]|nr:hypothetical protein HD806DRAFT_301490 [Xylariaceae sp. AK1471]
MAVTTPNLLTKKLWPSPFSPLTPGYLVRVRDRLDRLQTLYHNLLAQQDPALGYNLDALVGIIFAPAFRTLRLIAHEAPRAIHVDTELAALVASLAADLQDISGDANPLDLLSQVDILPDPDWDVVFRDYFKLLDAAVDTFVLWDTPSHNFALAGTATPDPSFPILRKMVLQFNSYPCLQPYYAGLMAKLDGSRSGACYTQHWMGQTTQAPTKSTPKRKADISNSPSRQTVTRSIAESLVADGIYPIKGNEPSFKRRLMTDLRRWPEWRTKINPVNS